MRKIYDKVAQMGLIHLWKFGVWDQTSNLIATNMRILRKAKKIQQIQLYLQIKNSVGLLD